MQLNNPMKIKEKLNSRDEAVWKGLINVQNLPREERREYNKMVVKCLLEVNGNRKQEALILMKQNIDSASCKKILADFNYDHKCLEKLEDWIEDVKLNLESRFDNIKTEFKTRCGIEGGDTSNFNLWAIFKRFLLVTASYFDLIKDSTLLTTLVYLLQTALFTHYNTFACMVTWHLAASILVPLVISALQTARHHPLLILGFRSWELCKHSRPSRMRLWTIKVFTVFFYPLVPAILLHAREEAKQRVEDLQEQGQMADVEMEEFDKVSEYLKEARKALLIFKRNEFGVEMVLQLTIQIVMVLLTITVSPTHTGLEAVFKKDFDTQNTWLGADYTVVLLICSILWSFVTSAKTYIKIKTEDKKDFLSITAKLLLGFRALLTTITRVGCIVAFLCPFLGLLGIMAHWTAETFSLDLDFRNDGVQIIQHYNLPVHLQQQGLNEDRDRAILHTLQIGLHRPHQPRPARIPGVHSGDSWHLLHHLLCPARHPVRLHHHDQVQTERQVLESQHVGEVSTRLGDAEYPRPLLRLG